MASSGDLYPFPSNAVSSIFSTNFTVHQSASVWHRRIGHPSSSILDILHSNKSIDSTTKPFEDCVSCCQGKSTRLPFVKVEYYANKPLFFIHIDIWQSPVLSKEGYKYYIVFVDDFLYPMKSKPDTFTIFCAFQALVDNLLYAKIKYFQSDGGCKYDNQPLLTHFINSGIYFCKVAPHTQQENGVAEGKHRHIVDMARILLLDASLPNHYWHEMVQTATYLMNRLPAPLLQGLSSYQKLFSKTS